MNRCESVAVWYVCDDVKKNGTFVWRDRHSIHSSCLTSFSPGNPTLYPTSFVSLSSLLSGYNLNPNSGTTFEDYRESWVFVKFPIVP